MAILTVTTLDDAIADDGQISLREAVVAANGDITVDGVTGSGADTIVFAAGLAGTIGLSAGELTIAAGSTIVIDGDTNGDGKADITLSGLDTTRIFELAASGGNLTLESLTLTDGYATDGGAISVDNGATLTVINSTLADNTSASGGAISVGGGGAATLINSTLAGNEAGNSGGAIRVGSFASALLINSTVTGNSAGTYGGAIAVAVGGQLQVQSSTISGNNADSGGGGIYAPSGVVAHLDNTIVAGNTSMQAASANTHGSGTILAHGSMLGAGVVAIDPASAGNISSDTPGLGALADNGGAVHTMALLAGSAAINAGSDADLPADAWDVDGDSDTAEALPVDARGFARSVGTTDIGAFELANQAPTTSGGSASMAEDVSHTFTLAEFNFDDQDGDALHSVTITALPAKGRLTLNGVTLAVNDVVAAEIAGGLLTFIPAPNGNGGPYASFTYTVSDGFEMSAAATFTLSVSAVNDAPAITSNGGGTAASLSFTENATRAVTTVASSDVDAGSVHSYSIAGGADAARFAINPTTGVLTFVARPDFDAPTDAGRNNVYNVTVRTTDNGGLTDTQSLAIAVTNVLGRTINGSKRADTVDGSKPAGRAATNEEDRIDGKKGNDKLKGLGGNDTLIGGEGKDQLTGGAGRDAFVFNSKLVAANVDTVKDFTHDVDLIHLENKIFKKIGPSLSSGEFYAKRGADEAHDRNDRIIYDKKSGKLYYDDDGKGGHAAVHFATLSTKPTLDHGDFLIV